MRRSDDQTLFAWHLNAAVTGLCGPLATSLAQFRGCKDLLPVPDANTHIPWSMKNKGLRIDLPLVEYDDGVTATAILQCSTMATYPIRITLPLVRATQQGVNHSTRDPNYTGSLPSVDPDLIEESITKNLSRL